MKTKIEQAIWLLLTAIMIALIFMVVLPTGSLLYTLLANTTLGFIIIFLVNVVFGLGIKYDLLVLIFVAMFGLFAVAVLIILNLLGMSKNKKIMQQI